MTEFERIKAMDVLELAEYINKLQYQAVDNYENGFFPNGIFDNIAMLEREVEPSQKPSLKSQVEAAQNRKIGTQPDALAKNKDKEATYERD